MKKLADMDITPFEMRRFGVTPDFFTKEGDTPIAIYTPAGVCTDLRLIEGKIERPANFGDFMLDSLHDKIKSGKPDESTTKSIMRIIENSDMCVVILRALPFVAPVFKAEVVNIISFRDVFEEYHKSDKPVSRMLQYFIPLRRSQNYFLNGDIVSDYRNVISNIFPYEYLVWKYFELAFLNKEYKGDFPEYRVSTNTDYFDRP